MQLSPENERTLKRILRKTIREQGKPDPGPDVTVDQLLEAVRALPAKEPK